MTQKGLASGDTPCPWLVNVPRRGCVGVLGEDETMLSSLTKGDHPRFWSEDRSRQSLTTIRYGFTIQELCYMRLVSKKEG